MALAAQTVRLPKGIVDGSVDRLSKPVRKAGNATLSLTNRAGLEAEMLAKEIRSWPEGYELHSIMPVASYF